MDIFTGTKTELGRLAANSLKLSAVPVKPEDQKNPADLFIHSTIFVVVDKHARLRGMFETRATAWIGPMSSRESSPPCANSNASDERPRSARRQRLAQRPERGFPDRRLYFHPPKKQNCAPQLHDGGVRHLDLFLACYLTYHGYLAIVLHHGPTRFWNPAWFRPIYLVILLTHTVLAVVIVPLILVTLNRALAAAFRTAQKNRPLDVAVVDVCFRDRRGGLSAALPDFSAAIGWSTSFSLSVPRQSYWIRKALLSAAASDKPAS